MIPAIAAILFMLALGFVTKYSGMDAVLGLAFTRTGPLLYPIFGTLLGWLGVALTGSDTSSNVLFGNLQKITAQKLGLDPDPHGFGQFDRRRDGQDDRRSIDRRRRGGHRRGGARRRVAPRRLLAQHPAGAPGGCDRLGVRPRSSRDSWPGTRPSAIVQRQAVPSSDPTTRRSPGSCPSSHDDWQRCIVSNHCPAMHGRVVFLQHVDATSMNSGPSSRLRHFLIHSDWLSRTRPFSLLTHIANRVERSRSAAFQFTGNRGSSAMRLCLVEDLAVCALEPLTLTRPVHELLAWRNHACEQNCTCPGSGAGSAAPELPDPFAPGRGAASA